MRRCVVGVALALSSSSLASARADPGPVTPAPALQASAAARDEGDRLIKQAGAADIFVNETGTTAYTGIFLRHKASGFACMLTPGQPLNSLTLYPNLHRGDDVGCQTMTLRGSLTVNFTRDTAHSDAMLIEGAARALQMHVPDAQPAPPPTQVRPYATMFPSLPVPKSARYVTSHSFEEDILGHVGDWVVEARFTAPRAMADSNMLDAVWYATVAEAIRHRAAETPAVAGNGPGVPGPAAVAPPPRPDPSTPPTPEERALARSEGDRIVLAAKAGEVFENVTDGRVPALRHRASGLVCRFNPGTANSVSVQPGMTPPGGAVTCVTGADAYIQITSITPNTLHRTVDDVMRQQLALLRAAAPGLKALGGPTAQANIQPKQGPPLPVHRTAQVVFDASGDKQYMYLSAAVVGDWVLTEQLRGPPDKAMMANLMGELALVSAMIDVAKAAKPAFDHTPPVI